MNESIRDDLVNKIEQDKESYMSEEDVIKTQQQKSMKEAASKQSNNVNTNPNEINISSNMNSNNNVNNTDTKPPIIDNKKTNNAKFFDPSRDKMDPNQRVAGKGLGHSWEETFNTIDIKIPIKFELPPIYSNQKDDVNSNASENIVIPIRKSDINIDIT